MYPVLQYNYHSHSTDTVYTNSLIFSPYTMQIMIYKNKIRIQKIDLDNYGMMYLLDEITKKECTMDRPFYIDTNNDFTPMILRKPVILTTLRNLYREGSGMTPDSHFVILKKIMEKNYLMNPNYLDNNLDYNGNHIITKYHPKSLVMMIQYYSKKKNKMKYTLIVNRDIDPNIPTGWDRIKSGIIGYINHFKQQLNQKKAFIFPILWYMADHHYPTKKVIYL